MDTSQRTSQLSAHLSWTAMRRYLQEKLSSEESQRVMQHLQHCTQCSSAIIDYIQSEEPQHYKLYTKKLKGIVVSPQSTKKRFLSPVRAKAIRATAAVVVLLIVSFFAVKAMINQSSTHPTLPSESLAVIKKPSESTVARLRAKREKAEKLHEDAKGPAKEENKKELERKAAKTKENKPIQREEAKTKKKAEPAEHQTSAAPAKDNPTAIPSEEVPAASTAVVEEANLETDKPVIPVAKPEIAKIKPLSAPKKLNAAQDSRNQLPTSIPVPDHQIREE